jgi:Large polyvalent protein-associated domain 7
VDKTQKNLEVQDTGHRLVLKGRTDPSIAPVIEKAMEKGWKSITVKGNWELCRATWFEGKMAGLEVKGYRPNHEDEALLLKMEEQRRKIKGSKIVLSGADIANDYNSRVVPHLKKQFEDLRKQRSKLGVTTTDTDRAYGINLPKGFAREVDEKFDRAKGALLRAIETRDFFLTASKERLAVKFSFEDGIARFITEGDEIKFARTGQRREIPRRWHES